MTGAIGIVGAGVCCPLGRSLDALWDAIAAGQDGFADVTRFPLPGLPTRLASAFSAAELDALRAEAGHDDPAVAFAILAARDALGPAPRDEVALILATSAGAADRHDAWDRARRELGPRAADALIGGAFTSFAATVARAVGLSGPILTVSTACASGGHALGLAADLLRSGEARRVLVVAADAVHPSLFAGFQSVGALASSPCAPFGTTFGMSLGEAGAAALLELDPPTALGWVLGWGGSCDAFHPTAPDPRGEGMARSLRAALDDAALRPDEIGAYNAHGTGTEANDPAETLAVRAVLGDAVPVSADKSQLGHTQGAAGLLEALAAVAALRAQAVPPTLRAHPARNVAPADPVADGRARPHAHEATLSHSAAFGGTNVSVALGRAPRARATRPRVAIHAVGIGAVGPFGEDVARALDPGCPPLAPTGPSPGSRMDPVTRHLTAAVAAAAARAGLDPRRASDAVALVAGMADGPQRSIHAFVASRDRSGLARASAAAFARMVFNAPAGGAAAALQLRGPNLTLWSGHGAGTQAIAAAARLLREHPALDLAIAAAADEDGHITRDRAAVHALPGAPIEAAAAIALSRGPGLARLAGAAWGPAAAWREVAARAVGVGGVDRAVISATVAGVTLQGLDMDAIVGHAPAAAGALAAAAAVGWIAAGRAARVLVLTVSEDAGANALLWSAPEAEEAP